MDAAAIANENFAGWIHKQGSFIRSWKRRFMVLSGIQLTYFDSANIATTAKEKGSLVVSRVDKASDLKNGLVITGADGRQLKIYTEMSDSRDQWYGAILQGLKANKLRQQSRCISRGTHLGRASSTVGEFLDENGSVRKEGYMDKEGGVIKSWKRRYFILEENHIVYFDQKDSAQPAKGGGRIIGLRDWKEKPYTLKIVFDNGRVLKVSAYFKSDFLAWKSAIHTALGLTPPRATLSSASNSSTLSPPKRVAGIDMSNAPYAFPQQNQQPTKASTHSPKPAVQVPEDDDIFDSFSESSLHDDRASGDSYLSFLSDDSDLMTFQWDKDACQTNLWERAGKRQS